MGFLILLSCVDHRIPIAPSVRESLFPSSLTVCVCVCVCVCAQQGQRANGDERGVTGGAMEWQGRQCLPQPRSPADRRREPRTVRQHRTRTAARSRAVGEGRVTSLTAALGGRPPPHQLEAGRRGGGGAGWGAECGPDWSHRCRPVPAASDAAVCVPPRHPKLPRTSKILK